MVNPEGQEYVIVGDTSHLSVEELRVVPETQEADAMQ